MILFSTFGFVVVDVSVYEVAAGGVDVTGPEVVFLEVSTEEGDLAFC